MLTKNHRLSSSLKARQAWITKYLGVNPSPDKTIMGHVNSINNLPHAVTKVNKRVELTKNQLTDRSAISKNQLY